MESLPLFGEDLLLEEVACYGLKSPLTSRLPKCCSQGIEESKVEQSSLNLEVHNMNLSLLKVASYQDPVCSTLDREDNISEYLEIEFLPKSFGNLITPAPLGYHLADLFLI